MFQQVTSAQKHLEKVVILLGDLSAIAAHKHEFSTTADQIKIQVTRKFDRWLEQNGGEIVALPHQLDLVRLAEASIWRQPPFSFDPKNPESEKGFRDALILETLCDYVSRQAQDDGIAFVCSDRLLLDTAKARFASGSRCSCYQSLAELASYLRLTLQRHQKEFTTSMLERATNKFFAPNDENCIWAREHIQARIEGGHEHHLKITEQEANQWEAATVGQWFIDNAQFDKSDGDETYYWQSRLTFIRVYNYKKPDWMSANIKKDKPNISVMEALGGVLSTFVERMKSLLEVTFTVFWSMKVGQDGRIIGTKVDKILFDNRSLAVINDQMRSRFKLTNI